MPVSVYFLYKGQIAHALTSVIQQVVTERNMSVLFS
jgi:hypothetical protein